MDWGNILENSLPTSLMTSVLVGLIAWYGGIWINRIRDREHLEGLTKLQEQITQLNHTLTTERDARADLLKRGTLIFQAQFEKEFEIYVSLSNLMGALYSSVVALAQERLHNIDAPQERYTTFPTIAHESVKPLIQMVNTDCSERVKKAFDNFSELLESCIPFVDNEIFIKVDEFRKDIIRYVFSVYKSFRKVQKHVNKCIPIEIEIHKMDHPNWTGDYIEQDELVEVNMNASNLEYMMARLKEVRQEALDLISNRIKSLNVIKND